VGFVHTVLEQLRLRLGMCFLISRGSHEKHKMSSTNLRAHMEIYHRKIYDQLELRENDATGKSGTKINQYLSRCKKGPAQQTVTEAQEPAVCTARSRLQLALHAQRDPLRDEIREVGRGLSLADSQTGRYVRLYSRRLLCTRRGADAQRSSESFSNLCNFWRLRPVLEISP
jgi:hypothetical protein